MTVFRKSQVRQLHEYIDRWFARTAQPLDIRRYEAPRSDSQQAYIHVLIRRMASWVGVCEDEMKQDILKRDSEGVFPHWPMVERQNLHGDLVMRPKSESKLTKREESELIERLHALCAEWGIELEAAA